MFRIKKLLINNPLIYTFIRDTIVFVLPTESCHSEVVYDVHRRSIVLFYVDTPNFPGNRKFNKSE